METKSPPKKNKKFVKKNSYSQSKNSSYSKNKAKPDKSKSDKSKKFSKSKTSSDSKSKYPKRRSDDNKYSDRKTKYTKSKVADKAKSPNRAKYTKGKPRDYQESSRRSKYSKPRDDDKKYSENRSRYPKRKSDDYAKSSSRSKNPKRSSDDKKYSENRSRYPKRNSNDKRESFNKSKDNYRRDKDSSSRSRTSYPKKTDKFNKDKPSKKEFIKKSKEKETSFKVQKLIANSGYTSRRTAEELIINGKVTTKDGVVTLGTRVSLDEPIFVDGKAIDHFHKQTSQLLMYNKPIGEIVSYVGANTVFENIPKIAVGKWINIGRLDVESEGLILFTNNGDLANEYAHPSFGVEREYLVKSRKDISQEKLDDIVKNGVNIVGETIVPIKFTQRVSKSKNYYWYEITLSQGRNRVIRKLFNVLDADVTRLIRIRFGEIILPKELKTGDWIYLKSPKY